MRKTKREDQFGPHNICVMYDNYQADIEIIRLKYLQVINYSLRKR